MSTKALILIGMNMGALLVIGVAWAALELADFMNDKEPKND
jgi:hypothetical protein